MIAEPGLLDDAVSGMPGFHLEHVGDAIQRLVMRAVHPLESVTGAGIMTERLHVGVFHLGKIVPGNVELQRAAKSDIQKLQAFADAEQGQVALRGGANGGNFPRIPRRLGFPDETGVARLFDMERGADVRAPRQQ